jgi:hypothetical protein
MLVMIDDIFEYLRLLVNCDYISDLQFGSYHEAAVIILQDIDITLINPQQYTDICQYLGI